MAYRYGYGRSAYYGIAPYVGGYACDTYGSDNYNRDEEVYNDHPYPTGGRPLGPVHRAAQAEGITLRHIPGCHREGRCERAQQSQIKRELRRRGTDTRNLTTRQALRVVRGLPRGEPDRTPTTGELEQASGQQQVGSAPGGAAPGGSSAGGMPQGGAGGAQPMGMTGGGGLFGCPPGGMNRPRGGGMGGMGGHNGMGGPRGGLLGGGGMASTAGSQNGGFQYYGSRYGGSQYYVQRSNPSRWGR